MIPINEIVKLGVLVGNAINTKKLNDQEQKNADEFYDEQNAYLKGQANSDAMATTAASAAIGAIDRAEERAQRNERNMAGVKGSTGMYGIRTKQAASEARADVGSAVHQQQQQQKLAYDRMLMQSKTAEYNERQKRIADSRASAQNVVTNAMQLAGSAGMSLGAGLEGTTTMGGAAKKMGLSKADMKEGFDLKTNKLGRVQLGADGTPIAYAKTPEPGKLQVDALDPNSLAAAYARKIRLNQ